MLSDEYVFETGLYTVVIILIVLVAIGFLELVRPGLLPHVLNEVLSSVIHVYLENRYPIKHRDGIRYLPTCPYRWPNGQGDVGKFLEGIDNSAAWEKSKGAVYRIWSGMKSEVVLTQPRYLQAVFKDSDKHTKAVANNSGYYMSQLLGQCVGLISGQEWRGVRSVVEVPFGHQVVSTMVAGVEHQVREYFLQLHDDGDLKQNLIHPAKDMKMLPFWVVAKIFYGRLPPHLEQQLKDLAPLREHVFKYVIQGGIPRFAFSRLLPTAANAALRTFKQRWRAFNSNMTWPGARILLQK